MPKRDIPPLDPKHMYHDTFSTPPEFAKATFRDVILEPARFQQYLPNIRVPYSYTIDDMAFIHPVRTGIDPYSHARFWDAFVIYDENLDPVPTVGSTRGIFLHPTGVISHHRVTSAATKLGFHPVLQYAVRLETLNVTKDSMTKDKNGIHVSYSLVDDQDLINQFEERWDSSMYIRDIVNGKLRSYFK